MIKFLEKKPSILTTPGLEWWWLLVAANLLAQQYPSIISRLESHMEPVSCFKFPTSVLNNQNTFSSLSDSCLTWTTILVKTIELHLWLGLCKYKSCMSFLTFFFVCLDCQLLERCQVSHCLDRFVHFS
jgi:hypothetical protein